MEQFKIDKCAQHQTPVQLASGSNCEYFRTTENQGNRDSYDILTLQINRPPQNFYKF